MFLSSVSSRQKLAGIAFDLSGIPHPYSTPMLQDVNLMREAAFTQHPQIDVVACLPFQGIHESCLIAPGQAIVFIVEDSNVDVAVRSKVRTQGAAVEKSGLSSHGGGSSKNLMAGRNEVFDPLL
jgi:hypothetical protein